MPVKKSSKGTWYTKFYYTDWNGERKQKKKEGFKTKREAEEFERDFINSHTGTPDITFKNLAERYLLDCETRLRKTTMVTKKNIVETKLVPYFKNLPITKIDALTIREWQNTLINDENEYNATYLKTIHSQMVAIMNYAVEFYKLPKNPVTKPMGKSRTKEMEFWTLDEFNTFIKETEDDILVNTVFNLLFFSGMREGELLALTLDDFDFQNDRVNINKSYAYIHRTDIIGDTKTYSSTRTISLPKEVMDKVQEYSTRLYGYKSNQRLFPYSKESLYSMRDKYCKITGVKVIRIHDIRHSHASLLIEKGVTPLLISKRLGHKNVQMTLNTYSHLYPKKHDEIADLLSNFVI